MTAAKKVLRNIKLTEDENKQLKAEAYAHGKNVSEYIRWLIERERSSVPLSQQDQTAHKKR